MGYFISIDVNNEFQKYIKKIQEDLNEINCDVSHTLPEQGHVTLKYLGELNEITLKYVRELFCELFCEIKQFEIYTTKINTFPSKKHARVIWIGIFPSKKLMKLYDNLCALSNKIDFKKTKIYPFIPHITIARMNRVCDKRELQLFFKRVSNSKKLKCMVCQIKLKKSILTPQGCSYEDVEIFTLNN